MANKTHEAYWFWNHTKKPTKKLTHISHLGAGSNTLCGVWGVSWANRVAAGYENAESGGPLGPPCPTCFKQMIKEITSS